MKSLQTLIPLLALLFLLVGGGVTKHYAAPPVKHLSSKSFTWRTENWGPCKAPGECGDGSRLRRIWCSELEGRATLDYLCDPAEKPEASKICFTACRHHRDKLQWQVGQWGPCLPVYPSSTAAGQIRAYSPVAPASSDSPESSPMAPIEEYLEVANRQGLEEMDGEALGVMQRAVGCVLVSHEAQTTHRTVDDDNCFTVARKPDPVRLCGVQTPQDCIVSGWSEWSGKCPEGCGMMNETRVRTVLVAPNSGGKPCPELVETRPCASVSRCQIKKTEIKNSVFSEYKLKVGEWRLCEAPAGVVNADVLALTNANKHKHAARINFNHESNFTFEPQVGYQSREVTCRDLHADIVDIRLCLENKQNELVTEKLRPCIVSQDCAVGPWSKWEKIQEGCNTQANDVRPEIQKRVRRVVSLQQGHGQPCPHLVEEKKIVELDALGKCTDKYHWMPTRWSPCLVTKGDLSASFSPVACGGGVQLRTLTCVETQGDKPVAADLCSTLDSLPTVQRCEVPCPRDCEVGAWSEWSICKPQSCADISVETPTQGFRERERLVKVAASRKGVECPAVREVQPCAHPTCFSWRSERWGACELDPGLVKCGEGRRARSVICESNDGVILDDFVCAKQELKPPIEEPCLQPCPFDCVLSPWSEWSPCSHPCSSNRQGALRQRNRTVTAPSGPGGHPCPDPDEMLQIEACNLHSCHGYSWFTMPWQRCEVQNGSNTISAILQQAASFNGDAADEEAICGRGVQKRDVWCMEANEKRVKESKCQNLMKPADVRVCNSPCPQNCEVSSWSAWSHCPQDCTLGEKSRSKSAPTQIRHRVILKQPRSGGSQCPVLEELRPCPLDTEMCKTHSWWMGEWSQCRLPSNVECGQGYRTRAIACELNGKKRVDPSECMQEGGQVPRMTEPCHVECDAPCVFSEWSSWSTCQQACGGTSIRRRSLLGLASSRPICRDANRFALLETRACSCSVFESKPEGVWSVCILDLNNFSEESANGRPLGTALCGAGRRFRARACRDRSGNLVEPSHCGDVGLVEEPCFVPCSANCVMGEWSTWGACSSPCGPGLQKRTREILQPALNNGRPCGAEVQTKLCNTPCSHFNWVIGGWEDCRLDGEDEQKGCGSGEQSRSVKCMYEPPHFAAVEVSTFKCDSLVRPESYAKCHITCPGECVVSPWSEWSSCKSPCRQGSKQQKTRAVLRAPAIHASFNCPPLIEVQDCILNETCFTFEWKITEWTSCLPLGGSPCGEGIQHKGVSCYRSDGRSVDDSHCNGRAKPTPSEKWCYVDCPVDCEVGEWSAWNETQCSCGGTGSKMRRTRFIQTNPSETGRPCPQQLKQFKPCPVVPCFNWVRNKWSKCDLHGADCGHGTVTRNVTCRREYTVTQADDDLLPLAIDDESCFLGYKNLPPLFNDRSFLEIALDLKKEDACYVPCQGDCEVGEWSRWSHCHRNCNDGEVGGYQTRSRAVLQPPRQNGEPCPAALWETRPCFSGPCLTYEWVLRDGKIICERSDGEIVTGGCEGKARPCVPACVVANSVCGPAGVCACAGGFGARFAEANRLQSHRLLRACVDMSQVQVSEAHRALDEAQLQARFYYPKDEDISVWMFAMIGIGCVFIVFVAVSFYIMCRSPATDMSRTGTLPVPTTSQTVTVRENPQQQLVKP